MRSIDWFPLALSFRVALIATVPALIYDVTRAGHDDYAFTLVIIFSVIVLTLLYATNKLVGHSSSSSPTQLKEGRI